MKKKTKLAEGKVAAINTRETRCTSEEARIPSPENDSPLRLQGPKPGASQCQEESHPHSSAITVNLLPLSLPLPPPLREKKTQIKKQTTHTQKPTSLHSNPLRHRAKLIRVFATSEGSR